jgi:hypothetical protein
MAVPLFTGNVIALIWDFDQTLIPGYQQGPLFKSYEIDEQEFWREVEALAAQYKGRGIDVSPDTTYLNHLLTYVKTGRLAGLTNRRLRELGAELAFYEGMPDFMALAKSSVEERDTFQRHSITIEHYVVSTGLRQMILGSAVAPHVKGVWACEFIEEPAAPGFLETGAAPLPDGDREISQVGYFLDNTTKTRAIWEINKGVNVDPQIGVNDLIAQEDRRVPLRNMLYIADGPSDIPVFSILNQYGGRTMGVYNPSSDKHFKTVKRLRDQGRVQFVAEADYRPRSAAARWILASLEEMAEVIVRDRERALVDRVSAPGGHVTS